MPYARTTSGISYIRALVDPTIEGQGRTVDNQLLNELAPAAITDDANVTYTAAQILNGIINRSGITVNRTDAFPTAANLVGGITGARVSDVGMLIVNNDDEAQTITVNGASTGITYDGAATAIAAGEARLFFWRLTNVTAASEAATVIQIV